MIRQLAITLVVLTGIGYGCAGPQSSIVPAYKKSRSIRIECAIPATVSVQKPDLMSLPGERSAPVSTPATVDFPDTFKYDLSFIVTVSFGGGQPPVQVNGSELSDLVHDRDTLFIPAPNYGTPPNLEPAIAAVKADLEYKLIDPTSPLFKWGRFTQQPFVSPKDGVLYGWQLNFLLNSKNKMGGYTGWKPCSATFREGKLVSMSLPFEPTTP